MKRLVARRSVTGGLIVAFWLVMTGWLMHREELLPGTRPAAATGNAASPSSQTQPIDTWMGLFMGDARVGTLHWRQGPERRSDEPGLVLHVRSTMTLDVLGAPTDLAIDGTAWRPDAATSADFRFDVQAGEHTLAVAGVLVDGVLEAEIESAGETLRWSRAVEGPWSISGGFGAPLTLPPLDVGEQIRIASFDPLTLRPQPARARCVAREMRTINGVNRETRVVELRAGGVESRAWIDDAGTVLRAETALGLAFEVIDPDPDAWTRAAEPASGSGTDLLEQTAVRPTGPQPFRGARTMVFQITAPADAKLPVDEIQQQLAPGRYRTMRVDFDPLAATPLSSPQPRSESGYRDVHLEADSLVQANHPTIVDHARAVTSDATTPWERALRLHEWVFTHVDKMAALSIPSALEVLRTRRGDCNEHTVLFTALARAVGIPTRMAVGVVWSDDLEGFYYHAWPEVHVGSWIAMDPTLGQVRADATHIKLLEGGIAEWSALVPFLGHLAIDIVEIE